jgi:hypothetical protein
MAAKGRKRTVSDSYQVIPILIPLMGEEGGRRGVSPNKINLLAPPKTPEKLHGDVGGKG